MINILRNIQFPITNTIYLTLADNQVEPSDEYWFKFTNRLTNDSIIAVIENISTKVNYQKFEIESDLFGTYDSGYWSYEVKASDNGNPIGNLLEVGYLYLTDDEAFDPIKYSDQSNNFKTYNG
jgi:hypothetical protein